MFQDIFYNEISKVTFLSWNFFHWFVCLFLFLFNIFNITHNAIRLPADRDVSKNEPIFQKYSSTLYKR